MNATACFGLVVLCRVRVDDVAYVLYTDEQFADAIPVDEFDNVDEEQWGDRDKPRRYTDWCLTTHPVSNRVLFARILWAAGETGRRCGACGGGYVKAAALTALDRLDVLLRITDEHAGADNSVIAYVVTREVGHRKALAQVHDPAHRAEDFHAALRKAWSMSGLEFRTVHVYEVYCGPEDMEKHGGRSALKVASVKAGPTLPRRHPS